MRLRNRSAVAGIVLLVAAGLAQPAPAKVHYVRAGAGGTSTGTSWADAYADLQTALAAAVAGDEIWVAAGTYEPTVQKIAGDPRSVTFDLTNGIKLYGGFAGTEASPAERPADPDPETPDPATDSVLSGDLAGNDALVTDAGTLLADPTRSENCYRVMTAKDCGTTTLVDGFSIVRGQANEPQPNPPRPNPPRMYVGGGLWVNASPRLVNCTFAWNAAEYRGGAVYNEHSSAEFLNCRWAWNYCMYYGGALCNQGGSAGLRNCTFFKTGVCT